MEKFSFTYDSVDYDIFLGINGHFIKFLDSSGLEQIKELLLFPVGDLFRKQLEIIYNNYSITPVGSTFLSNEPVSGVTMQSVRNYIVPKTTAQRETITVKNTEVLAEYDMFYNLSGGNTTYGDLSKLAINSWFQKHINGNFCFKQLTKEFFHPIEFDTSFNNPSSGSTSGSTDGDITITVINGGGNYEYSIDNGDTWQSSNTFSSLWIGDYVVKVKSLDEDVISVDSDNITLVKQV